MSNRVAWQVTDDAAVSTRRASFPPSSPARLWSWLDAVGIGRGERVLDVGCGTGAATREAARRVGAEGRVVGLDLNPRMLAVAARVAPEIEWRQGDAGDLPFEDGAFDVVVSQFALMFFPDQWGALPACGGSWRRAAGSRSRSAARSRTAPAMPPSRRSLSGSARPRSSTCCARRSRSATGQQLAELARAAGIDRAEAKTFRCPGALPLDRCSGAHRDHGLADPGHHRRGELRGAPARRARGARALAPG